MKRATIACAAFFLLAGCNYSPITSTPVLTLPCEFCGVMDTATPTRFATLAPRDEPTATLTMTSSIVEVTSGPTDAGSIEVGTLNGPPSVGDIVEAPGWFEFYSARNVRACPSLSCSIIGSISPFSPFRVEGWALASLSEVWVCELIVTDAHGAQLCENAILWIDASGRYGNYDATATPVPTSTDSPTPGPTPTRIVQGD